MLEEKQGKDVVLTTTNKTGLLYELSKLLSEKGVAILGVIGAVSGGDCLIRLVTDDNLRTMDALKEKGYEPMEEDVVLLEVPHRPGMLKRVTEALAEEDIDIHYVYATALENGYTSRTTLRDVSVRCGRWSPRNYNGSYGSGGRIAMTDALRRSLNSTAVATSLRVGRKKVIELTKLMGYFPISGNVVEAVRELSD